MIAKHVMFLFEQCSDAGNSVSKEYGIPEAPKQAVYQQVSDFTNVTEVFFDIETTGLSTLVFVSSVVAFCFQRPAEALPRFLRKIQIFSCIFMISLLK